MSWALLSPAAWAQDGGLNFETLPEATTIAVSVADSRPAYAAWATVVAIVGICAVLGWTGRRAASADPFFRLSRLPVPVRMALTCVVLIYGATHLLGAVSVYLQTRVVYATGAEYFQYLAPARLASLSHAHLMGLATLQGVVAVLYGVSTRDGVVPRLAVSLAFAGVFADIGAWWLIKYSSPGWEIVSTFAGSSCALAYLWMGGAVLIQTWRMRV